MSDEHPRIRTLGEILGLDQGDSPEAEVFRLYLSLDIRTDSQLLNLAARDRYVWLIYRLDSEVQNGGIEGFFLNSSGRYVGETLESLQAIGALQSYRTLKQICDLFPGGTPAQEQDERQNQIRAITAAANQSGDVLMEDLVELNWDTNLFELLLEYRRQNI